MNLRRFEIFRAVVESATLTGAAQRLNLTQPAVTKAIQQLEDELGLTLFERSRGRLQPNNNAKDLYEYLEEIFLRLSMLKNFSVDRRELRRGHVNFACNAFFSAAFMPKIVRDFHDNYPGITISMQTRSSNKINELVDSGLLNIGIGSPIDYSPNVKIEPLLRMRGVCVLPPGHPLEGKKIVTSKDLIQEPFITTSDLDRTRGIVDTFFEPENKLRNVLFETSLASDACLLVAEGLGVTIVNELSASLASGVVLRPLKNAVYYDMNILTGYRHPLTLAETAFVESVQRVTAEIVESIMQSAQERFKPAKRTTSKQG